MFRFGEPLYLYLLLVLPFLVAFYIPIIEGARSCVSMVTPY